MAQVGIVRIGTAYFREYALEPGDQFMVICLSFGQRDWLAVYNHPANAAFKTRFPDPDQIDVGTVNLFIPLAGARTSGKSKRGKPVGAYLIARISRPDGSPVAGEKFRLTGPRMPAGGAEVTTTATGEVIRTNAEPGDWFLASAMLTLTLAASVATIVPPRTLNQSPPPVVSDPVKLTRNAIDELVARPVRCLQCPMCRRTFAVTVQSPSVTAYTCPNDAFTWTGIVNAIQTAEMTFLSSPMPAQNPTATPFALHCRGVEPALLLTAFGSVRVYWDESRFALPDGENYQLWGRNASGTTLTANVISRHTWGAAAPRVGGNRKYEFHATRAGESPAFTFAIPSNETTPLTGVLNWISIHHSTDSPQNSFATAVALQNKHFEDIGGSGPGADIGYHFIIDGDGKIYEGRSLGIKGSHVPLFNGGNIGIVLAGDFERIFQDTPTPAQLGSLNTLIDVLAARFAINSVWWHQERDKQAKSKTPTDCPGARLIPLLASLRTKYPGPPP